MQKRGNIPKMYKSIRERGGPKSMNIVRMNFLNCLLRVKMNSFIFTSLGVTLHQGLSIHTTNCDNNKAVIQFSQALFTCSIPELLQGNCKLTFGERQFLRFLKN